MKTKHGININKIYFCVILCSVFCLVITSQGYGQEKQLNDNAMRAMLALNYCHMALVNILAYEDRIILDEEYNNIINNISLSAIQDEEVVTILKQLMDTLITFKLTEEQTARLLTIYNQQVVNAVYVTSAQSTNDVIIALGVKQLIDRLQPTMLESVLDGTVNGTPGGIYGVLLGAASGFLKAILTGTTSPIGAEIIVPYVLSKIGGLYQNYRENTQLYRQALDEKLWKLDTQTIQAIHEMRKSFLQVYWTLMKRYNIPENLRLTEEQLRNAVEVFKIEDVEKRYRQLERLQQDFQAFPPFWYKLAQTAQELGHLEETVNLYQKIEQEYHPFFRKDHELAAALMDKVVLIESLKLTHPEILVQLNVKGDVSEDLKRILAESNNDWRNNVFVALQYEGLKNYDAAKNLIIQNIDNEKELSLNFRLLGEIYALTGEQKALTNLIRQMYDDKRVTYQDMLYLIGNIQDQQELQNIIQSLFFPVVITTNFNIESSLISEDTLKITIPTIWMKDYAKNLTVQIHFVQEDKTIIAENKVVMDEQANTATFSLQGVINKDDMLRNRVKLPLVVELVHPAQSVAFLVNVSVQDVAVEKNIIDKSVDSSKQVIDDAVGFYKGLFSKKEDDSQLETLEKNEQQSIKMESKIVFALQRIATSNACYEMNDNTITRFSSCQMNSTMKNN